MPPKGARKDPTKPQTASSRVRKPRAPRASSKLSSSADLTDALTQSERTSAEATDITTPNANSTQVVLPDVDGAPPAWSNNRTDLSDTLSWFKAYQGGSYHTDLFCWGFLVDGDSGGRSYVGDEVIITRIGGKSEKTGKVLTLSADQTENDTEVKVLRKTMNSKLPVAMIIGSNNTDIKRKLPHRYNVMAYFRITHIWNERVDGKVAYKVRFEKLNLREKSWWAVKEAPPPVPLDQRSTKPEIHQCVSCHTESIRMYKEGWMCLNRECPHFWTLGGQEPSVNLAFDESFLEWRSPEDPTIQPHYALVTDYLRGYDENDPHLSTLKIGWKQGVVCPLCRRCIPRTFWNGWKCSDSTSEGVKCPYERFIPIHPMSVRAALGHEVEPYPIRRAMLFQSAVIPQIDDVTYAPYRLVTYQLEMGGYIMHFVANKAINERKAGPNDLFRELQVDDLGLKRQPMKQSKVAGQLTGQYGANYGLPYNYVVSMASRSFSEACDPILRALGRLTWSTRSAVQSVGSVANDPNEMLLLGYFEGMKIGYHDDGESSLGPTIATLSLGSPAKMGIRLKRQYYYGLGKADNARVIQNDPVIPNCKSYDERLELKTQLQNQTISETEYRQKFVALCKKHKKSTDPPDLVNMDLNHGDMIVMHGEDLQKYYEHGVSMHKQSKLRFALTARYIKKDQVAEADWPKGDFNLTGDQVYDGK